MADDDPSVTETARTANTFLVGLREHRVYRVALGYAFGAWIILQVAAIVLPGFAAPQWVLRALMILLALGFGVALLAGWSYDRRVAGKPLLPRAPQRKVGWVATALLPAAAVAALFLLRPSPRPAPVQPLAVPAMLAPAAPAIPEKSIAVLPFRNLSADENNAFFTDGVQDEILTDLANIADLKVISRTSVMQYKGEGVRNLREIAAQLGVAHVVEGSVQRAGNEVRVDAQLIDARTDVHEWALNYDRPLDNIFAIQSEIAQAIADQLRAKISPDEHNAMMRAPTSDVVAFQLYQQAAELESHESEPDARDSLLQAVTVLEQAVKRDPRFVAGYCLLAEVHLDLYWEDFDHTDARRELAHAAIDRARQLQPDAGETHVALAIYNYRGFHDYDGALTELAIARKTLPNSAKVTELMGIVHRRQGRWDEAIRELEQAVDVDPRNFGILSQTAFTCTSTRRFTAAAGFLVRALSVEPGDVFVRETLAMLAFYERADLQPLDELNAQLLAGGQGAELAESAYFRLFAALAENNPAAAKQALASFPARGFQDTNNFFLPPEWYAGLTSRTFGDAAAARTAFTAARSKVEQTVREHPQYAEAWSALGLIDSGLGRNEEAISEAQHACDLLPITKDAFDGPSLAANLGVVYAWAGEKDLALQQVALVSRLSGGYGFSGISYGDLKHDRQWDALRGDPRFEAVAASLAPKP